MTFVIMPATNPVLVPPNLWLVKVWRGLGGELIFAQITKGPGSLLLPFNIGPDDYVTLNSIIDLGICIC